MIENLYEKFGVMVLDKVPIIYMPKHLYFGMI